MEVIKLALSKPHGGTLVNRFNPTINYEEIDKQIELSNMELSDLELLAVGAYSPLEGFIGKADYESILHSMRLANGLPWSIPITLAVDKTVAKKISIGEKVRLVQNGEVYGVIEVIEKYLPNKEVEAFKVYRTTETAHPGVKRLFERPNVYIAGPIHLVKRPKKKRFGTC